MVFFTLKSNRFYQQGDIKAGIPPFELPPFSINKTNDGNNNTVWLSFPEICSELGGAIGLIPLIAILEQVAIAKSFGIQKIARHITILCEQGSIGLQYSFFF